VLVDLDPQDCSYDLNRGSGADGEAVLDEIGLEGYPKTTGGKGMHIYIPVGASLHVWKTTRHGFAELLSRLVVHEKPQMYTTPRSVAKRQKNRVYFDYLQNGLSKTIAAAVCSCGRRTRERPVAHAARMERSEGRDWIPSSSRFSTR